MLDARPTPPGIVLVGLHGQSDLRSDTPALHGRGVDLAEIRVPLLWRPPRMGAVPMVGRRITTPVSTLDVAPTLLDAAGVARPAAFEGSPLPLADPVDAAEPTRAVFAEHPRETAVIVGAEYAAVPREAPADSTGSSARTAALWTHDGRFSEQLPAADSPAVAAERLARLRPTLDYFRKRIEYQEDEQP